jgi:hypothetical protein
MAVFTIKPGTNGLSPKAVFSDSSGQLWDTTGTPAFESPNSSQWTAGNYWTAMTAVSGFPGWYQCTIPSTVASTSGAVCEGYLATSPALGSEADYRVDASSGGGDATEATLQQIKKIVQATPK